MPRRTGNVKGLLMKKNVAKLLVVALVVILAVALAACNPTGGNQGGDHQGGTVDTLTYTVTFDTNGGDTSFDSYTLKNVASGSYISAPTRADGSAAIPVKTGYTFKYWSETEEGEEAYDFSTPVRYSFELYAIYEINKYDVTFYEDTEATTTFEEINDIEYKTTYNPHGWNEYPEVTPPYDVMMRIKMKNGYLRAGYLKKLADGDSWVNPNGVLLWNAENAEVEFFRPWED